MTAKTIMISAISLLAALLLCFGAYTVAEAVPVPVKFSDLKVESKTAEDGVFTLTVQTKAGGLYCSGCDFSVKDGVLSVTVTGTPKHNASDTSLSEDEPETIAFTYEYDETVEKIEYAFKYEKSALITLEKEEEESI